MGCLASKPATDEEKQEICKIMAREMMRISTKDVMKNNPSPVVAAPSVLGSVKDLSKALKDAADEASATAKKVKNILHVESRAESWDAAADDLVQKLEAASVAPSQILSIDAHNNEPDGSAIFSAHYCPDLVSRAGAIKYKSQNTDTPWEDFYAMANSQIAKEIGVRGQILAVTGSCNCGGSAVYYVFHTESSRAEPDVVPVQHLEVREDSWTGAADALLAKFEELEIKPGHIISIDAHNNGPDDSAIFSAHYRMDVPGRLGSIKYKEQNADYGWDEFYSTASTQISDVDTNRRNILAMTGSCNSEGNSVFYMFYNDLPEDASGGLLDQAKGMFAGARDDVGKAEAGGGMMGAAMGFFGKVADITAETVTQAADLGTQLGTKAVDISAGALAELLNTLADGVDKAIAQVEEPMATIGKDIVTAKNAEILEAFVAYFNDVQVPGAAELCLGKDLSAISKALLVEAEKKKIAASLQTVADEPMSKHKVIEGWKQLIDTYNSAVEQIEQMQLPLGDAKPAAITLDLKEYICIETTNDLCRCIGLAEEAVRKQPVRGPPSDCEWPELFEKVFKINKDIKKDVLLEKDYKLVTVPKK